MNMQECSRIIIGLRSAGWTDKQITDFILYVEGGKVDLPIDLPKQDV